MLTKALKLILTITVFGSIFLVWFSQSMSQTTAYNEARMVDAQDSLHRTLENIALDELTVNIDEELRKQNVAIIENTAVVKSNIKSRFYEYVGRYPDFIIDEYKVISPDSKIKGTYSTRSDKLTQSYEQLPEVAIDVKGRIIGTIADKGKLQESNFSFRVSIKTDFIVVDNSNDSRQNRTTNKTSSSDSNVNYNFKSYKSQSYNQQGDSFLKGGVNIEY